MADHAEVSGSIRFAPFELVLEPQELRRNGIRVKVSGQALQVLIVLASEPLARHVGLPTEVSSLLTRDSVASRIYTQSIRRGAFQPNSISTYPTNHSLAGHPTHFSPACGRHEPIYFWISASSFRVELSLSYNCRNESPDIASPSIGRLPGRSPDDGSLVGESHCFRLERTAWYCLVPRLLR